MPASILAFPLRRRRDLIHRQAVRYCEQPTSSAEKNLRHQMLIQATTLRRKGIDEAEIQHQVRALEQAIRDETLRLIFASGGVG